jgi:hypothetical protein
MTQKEIHLLWTLAGPECKALTTLRDSGRMSAAREAIIADAEASLARLPTVTALDFFWALEFAAETYLRRNPIA